MDTAQAWSIVKQAAVLRKAHGGSRAITDSQLAAVNATMADVLMDKGLRLSVLAVLLQYDTLGSSTELKHADAHAILSAAYPGAARPGIDEPNEGFVKLVRRAERKALKELGQMELF